MGINNESMPNYIELSLETLSSTPTDYSVYSIYSDQSKETLKALWESIKDENKGKILENDMFFNYLKSEYEIVELTSIYKHGASIREDAIEYAESDLNRLGWKKSADYSSKDMRSFNKHNAICTYAILLKKKNINHLDTKPTIKTEAWNYKEKLNLSLFDSLKYSEYKPTVIFVEENSIDYWNTVRQKMDGAKLISESGMFDCEKLECGDEVHSLTDIFESPQTGVVVKFTSKDMLTIQEGLKNISSEFKHDYRVIIVDKDYKQSKRTFTTLPKEIAERINFTFVSDSLTSIPSQIKDANSWIELLTVGVGNIHKIRERDRECINAIVILPSDDEKEKFINSDNFDSFDTQNPNQKIFTTKIVAKDHEEFMKKAKSNLGIKTIEK